jgi:hypothetical protein
VLSAVRALRVERRIGRARSLLADYLRRFPDGSLAEDALALQIEAATADRDRIAARELAARYLREYPTGRFRSAAGQALNDFSKEERGSHP